MRRKICLVTINSILLLCLAACVQAQNAIVRHSFTNVPDGANPWQLTWANGVFYGVTVNGGANNFGSLFRFGTNGAYARIYDFTGATNGGESPLTPLVVGNMIYGTTEYGGTNNQGAVYSVSTNGTGFVLLHSFNYPAEYTPRSGLVFSGGMLYGTASVGGPNLGGAIYRINTNGSGYSPIHLFTNSPDGFTPLGDLLLVSNVIYGTTTAGGVNSNGVVFAYDINASSYRVIYSFSNSADGYPPSNGGLAASGSVLFGVTGGSTFVNTNGTVYSINSDGSGFRVLHRFTTIGFAATNADGKTPKGTLSVNGSYLFGTTANGGPAGGGVVFLMNTNGSGFSVLNYFTNSGSSYDLENGVIRAGNSVWGTTYGDSGGPGTVFSIAMPAITAQPQDLSVAVTSNATFNVTAADNIGINYRWYFNTNTLLAGQGPTLILTNVQTTNSGTYTAVVSDSFGSVTSNPAHLVVTVPGTPPFITQQPQNVSVTNGGSVGFTNIATGTAPIVFNWYFNTNTFLTSNTSGILIINPATTNSVGYYSAVVTNAYGSTNSFAARLTAITPPPNISRQPQNITVTNGYDASFTNVAAGDQPLSYQWYFNTNTPVPGGTNAILTVPFVLTNNAGYYNVVVTNAGGATTSSPALLTVVSTKPIIFSQPQSTDVASGDTATFSVTAAGKDPLRYQWYYNTVSNSLGNLISGFTNSSISFAANTVFNGRYYSVLISNSLGKATSSPALLTVVTKPVIATNPQPQTVTAGDSAAFFVSAIGPNLAYQWYSNSVPTSIGTPLAGETSSSYSFTASTNQDGSFYSVVVTNIYGKATSSPPAMLTVQLPAGQPKFLGVAFMPPASISITVSNTAGSANRLWSATNLATTVWDVIASNVVPVNGLWIFTDTNVVKTNQMRFYRASSP